MAPIPNAPTSLLRSRITRLARIARHFVSHPKDARDLPGWVADWNVDFLSAGRPWWNYATQRAVAQIVGPGARVFEYGGGGSTLWLARTGAAVRTVEHDPEWFEALRRATADLANVDVVLVPGRAEGTIAGADTPLFFDQYAESIQDGYAETYDLVVVDGRARVECLRRSKGAVRPGGTVLLDDSERPRYAAAFEMFEGWACRRIRGVKPSTRDIVETTLWTRPEI